MLKATTPLLDLSPDRIDLVLRHPAQIRMLSLVEELVERLRGCQSALEYRELQADLIADLHSVEERRNECTWAFKRLRKHRRLPAIAPLPGGRDESSAEEWAFEAYVFARLARQLRTIGDGLAWRCFGYDRRVILTLARNQSSGTIHGEKGLDQELGLIDRFWETTGQFALHHDSTNCLRITDVTEFHDNGTIRFVEVKSSDKRRSAQTQRAQQAVNALMNGGPLPGAEPSSRFVVVPVDYATDLEALGELLTVAERDGVSSSGLHSGRAVLAIDVATLAMSFTKTEEDLKKVEGFRDAALTQAGMLNDTQHVVGRSIDTATRSPLMVPFSVYPFSARQCARLICDYLTFETILSVDLLAAACRDAGFGTRIELPSRNGHLAGDDRVLAIAGPNGRTLVLHNQGLSPLMYELVDPRLWVQGIAEILGLTDFSLGPHPVFTNEAATWA